MDFYRIGDKIISVRKIGASIDKILRFRSQGKSQQDVADIMNVDRSFISRLENLGEMRKGKNIGVIGFPIKNKDEIKQLLLERGIENCILMNEKERNQFVDSKSGSELANEIMALLKEYRAFDTVIVLASDMRTQWLEALFDQQVITVNIGASPLTNDVYVDTNYILEIVDHLL